MKKMMKKVLFAVLCVTMLVAFAACGSKEYDSDLAYLQDKGSLTIGITLYQPMNYYEGNELVGFDTEFALAVCEELGLEADFKEIVWETKDVELASNYIDCIWNGLTVSEERKENMDFTQSYIVNKQVAVIRAEDAALYTDAETMAAAKFVAEAGSAGEKAVQGEEAWAAVDYKGVDVQSTALLEVKSGTADVAVLDYVMASAMIGEGTDYADLMIVETLELLPEEYAIGFRLGSDVVDVVNEAIDKLAADGTLEAIAEKYELTEQLVWNQK